MGQGCGVERRLQCHERSCQPHALIRSAVGIKSLPPSGQLNRVKCEAHLSWQRSKARVRQAKVQRPVLWYANLLHAHGVSQEASLVVSDPGNKKEVAGVKMPDPGQWVCSGGGGREGTEQGSVIQPRPPCSSLAPRLSSSLLGCRSSEQSCPPSLAHLSQLGQSSADNPGQSHVTQPLPQRRGLR